MPTAASTRTTTMTKVDAAVTPSELGEWLGLSEAQTLLGSGTGNGNGNGSSGKAKTPRRRRRSSARGRRRTSLDDPTDAPGFGIDETALLLGCRIAATDQRQGPTRGRGGSDARGRASQETAPMTNGVQRAHSSPSRPAFHAQPPLDQPAGRSSTHGSSAGWDSEEEESPYLRSVSRESHLSTSSNHGLATPAVSHEQNVVGPTHGPAPRHDPQAQVGEGQVGEEGTNLPYLASFHQPSLLTAMERSRTTAPRTLPSRRIAALVRKSDATRGMLLHALGTPSGSSPPPGRLVGAPALGRASPYEQHRRDFRKETRRASAPESPTKVAQRSPFPSYGHHFFRNKRLSMDAMRPRMGGWKGDANAFALDKGLGKADVHERVVSRSSGRWMPTPKPPPEGEDAVQAELRRIALEMGVQ